MRQEIRNRHDVDADGNPFGGKARGLGLSINWQKGPLGFRKEGKEPNGAFVEGPIEACISRLEWYQTVCDGKFKCDENAAAIEHLNQALDNLDYRTKRRVDAGTEGTHEAP